MLRRKKKRGVGDGHVVPRLGDWGKEKIQGRQPQRLEAWESGAGQSRAWDGTTGRRGWGHKGDRGTADGEYQRVRNGDSVLKIRPRI